MKEKRVILTGASGMVGGIALRICLDHHDVFSVTSVGRRTIGIDHPNLREVVHQDFLDFAAVGEALQDHDLALFCLGVYTGAVPDVQFRQITVDYTPGVRQGPLRGQSASRLLFAQWAGGRPDRAKPNGLCSLQGSG